MEDVKGMRTDERGDKWSRQGEREVQRREEGEEGEDENAELAVFARVEVGYARV